MVSKDKTKQTNKKRYKTTTSEGCTKEYLYYKLGLQLAQEVQGTASVLVIHISAKTTDVMLYKEFNYTHKKPK